mmetsp:Transcript_31773/g.90237  ORF Transcript_31773/g.90237 Transcript_31773/m.90237 type:complete len:237 (-) Transcript_31773:55-765(-)
MNQPGKLEGATPAGGGTQRPPACQFPGCTADLSTMPRFNIRCKICDVHCKAESVTLNGQEQRFCQQCNRFHPVHAFDKGKRGCREKLEKHNKRRCQNRLRKATEKKRKVTDDDKSKSMPNGEAPKIAPTVAGSMDLGSAAAILGGGGANGAPESADDWLKQYVATSTAAVMPGPQGGDNSLQGQQPLGAFPGLTSMPVTSQTGAVPAPGSAEYQSLQLMMAYASMMANYPGVPKTT